jgi:hypothetical protein
MVARAGRLFGRVSGAGAGTTYYGARARRASQPPRLAVPARASLRTRQEGPRAGLTLSLTRGARARGHNSSVFRVHAGSYYQKGGGGSVCVCVCVCVCVWREGRGEGRASRSRSLCLR